MTSYSKFLKFLPLAKSIRDLSKDPSTQVGALAMDDDYNIRAVGYNGFPRGVKDDPELLSNREEKYPRIVHAEANLVATAARTGVTLAGTTVLLTSLHPCAACAGILIQAGVKRVLAPQVATNSRWDNSSQIALDMFLQSGVELIMYNEEMEIDLSLTNFKSNTGD